MKVNDILEIAQGRVIAWDARTVEQIFDTSRNKQNHVMEYGEGRVSSIWSGLKQDRSNWPLDGRNVPVIGIYVAHNSWEEGVPAADVKPVVRGEWIRRDDSIFAECPKCWCEVVQIKNFVFRDGKGHIDFCPNCGEDMRGENEQ